MSTYQTVRAAALDLQEVLHHKCPLIVVLFAKCAETQVIWDQSASCWHGTTPCSMLFLVLKACISWLRKYRRQQPERQVKPFWSVPRPRMQNCVVIRQKCQGVTDTRKSCSWPEKIERKGQRMSLQNRPARPETVQHVLTTLLPVPLELEPTLNEGTDKPDKTPRRNSILFQAAVPTPTEKRRKHTTNNVT